MSSTAKTGGCTKRRGSIYAVTVGASALVMVLGLSAVSILRVERKGIVSISEMSAAQGHARSGIEIALHRISTNSNWRVDASGWDTNQAIGDGHFRLQVTDPKDDNLTNSDYDPALITCIGSQGDAVQRLQATVEFPRLGLRCMEAALHAGGNVQINGVNLHGDGIVSANGRVTAENSAQVYAPVEAAGTITAFSGAQYHHGTSVQGSWPRTMPAAQDVLNYYGGRATSISYDGTVVTKNLVSNGGAESGSAGWSAWGGCEIEWTADKKHSGTYSFLVKNRSLPGEGAAIEVAMGPNGGTYQGTAWIRSVETELFRISLQVTTTTGTSITPLSSWISCKKNDWQEVSGSAPVNWTGDVTAAVIFVESQQDKRDFWIDDVSISNLAGTLENILLSPTSNPFGSTNAYGGYVIDCGGKALSVRNCRILGTLIVLNPSALTISESVHWMPAERSWDGNRVNLPALVSGGTTRFVLSANNLNESDIAVNLNPSGTPYLGATNGTQTDQYPSQVHGLIYVTGDLEVGGQTTLRGATVSHGNIAVKGTRVNLVYSPNYLIRNAAPLFEATVVPQVKAGSIVRHVDSP